MKAVPLAFRGVLLGLVTTSLHAQGPVLSTPGTATWSTELTTGGGTRTIFTITENTVLDWNQLNLETGNELVFDFLGGESVVNNLTGAKTQFINGSVTANGIVGFFSPNANLVVNGNISATGVTIATLGVDPVDFANGGGFDLVGGMKILSIGGQIDATAGDVVLGGGFVLVGGSAEISATGAALFAGGQSAEISPNGPQRVSASGLLGQILHRGTTTAGTVEASAVNSITNNGRIDAGSARVFLQVGTGGKISNESPGIIVGNAVFDGANVDKGLVLRPNNPDNPPLINESRLKVPTLKRRDGSKITTKETVSYSSAPSASSDASRASKQSSRQVARVDSSNSLLKRSSFFGMRGGSKTIASR